MHLPTRVSLPQEEPATPASWLARMFLQEDLNFLITNRLPRALVTRAVGKVSRIRSRRFTRAALGVWGLFADDLRLAEAEHTDFQSLHECFVRRLAPGARPVDPRPDVLTSPCDAVVGACGRVEDGMALQAKGAWYPLADLLPDPGLARAHTGSTFVTLRLKANMYHRFHAPASARLTDVWYVSGDTWNVNPVALKRVERLFCKNERAVMHFDDGLTLVAVAAIAVASIRVHALDSTLDLGFEGVRRHRPGVPVGKGEELGYFHAGSTLLVFAPSPLRLAPEVVEGATIRVGQPLLLSPPGALS